MTTLNTRHLMPISGFEFVFQRNPWHESEESGNCMSYALGHFKLGAHMKPQPGDIARAYEDLRRGYSLDSPPTWGDCTDIRKRMLADGVAGWRLLGFSGQGQTIKEMDPDGVAPPGYYKIMSFTDSSGTTWSPSDYHFYVQNAVNVSKLYTIPLFGFRNDSNVTLPKTPYEELGIDPFVSGNHLEDMGTSQRIASTEAFRKISGESDVGEVPKHLARSVTNTNIHVSRLPEYVIREGNFLPDPFWILGVHPYNPDSRDLIYRRQQELRQVFDGNPLHKMTVDQATSDALRISTNPAAMPKKQELIGLWSHKLGWATGAINTDADMKLIFDPRRANRVHSGTRYDNSCTAFAVMRGQGIGTLPPGKAT